MTTGIESFIGSIYEAAVLPENWPDVLVSFARYAECAEAVLITSRSTNFMKWAVSSPRMAELVQAHADRAEQNIRTQRLAALRYHGFVRDVDVLSADEIENSPLYQELLFPNDFGAGVATLIQPPSGEDIIFHAERSHRQGPVSDETVALLDRIRPHFARAALLSSQLNLERATTTASALSWIGIPAAVLGAGGYVLAANTLLEAMMPDAIRIRSSRIQINDVRANSLFNVAMVRMIGGDAEAAVASIPLRAKDDHPPYIVHIVPVSGDARDLFSSATAILIVTPVIPSRIPGANVVQGLFDLTASESRLAVLIASGLSPKESAVQLGISPETASTVLKRLFSKTGMRKQSDLVGLLSGNIGGGVIFSRHRKNA